jgi:hypothetical protein
MIDGNASCVVFDKQREQERGTPFVYGVLMVIFCVSCVLFRVVCFVILRPVRTPRGTGLSVPPQPTPQYVVP